jgi:ComF family protein
MPYSPLTSNLLALVTTIGRSLEHAVLPATCVFCGSRPQRHRMPICNGCYADLPWIERACPRCASPVASELPNNVCCGACQQQPPPFFATVAPLSYDFPIDAAIKAMKFKRRLFYAPAFAHLLFDALMQLPADIDGLLPVPLHWRRQALRGFNQAAEISRPLRRKTGLPLVRNVLRSRATPYQSGLTAAHRQRNLIAAFSVRGELKSRHVLIVDDVVTTGETCRQLANVLLDAGAERVSVLAIARA